MRLQYPCVWIIYNTGGSETVIQMTNFEVNEFCKLWLLLQNYGTKSKNVGRGRKSKLSRKRLLILVLTAPKHGWHWDEFGRLFAISGPIFGGTGINFSDVVNEEL